MSEKVDTSIHKKQNKEITKSTVLYFVTIYLKLNIVIYKLTRKKSVSGVFERENQNLIYNICIIMIVFNL